MYKPLHTSSYSAEAYVVLSFSGPTTASLKLQGYYCGMHNSQLMLILAQITEEFQNSSTHVFNIIYTTNIAEIFELCMFGYPVNVVDRMEHLQSISSVAECPIVRGGYMVFEPFTTSELPIYSTAIFARK